MFLFHTGRKLFIGLCCILFLTGCAQATIHMKTGWDLSGTYEVRILNDPRLSKLTDWLIQHYQQKGYRVERIKEKGNIGFFADKKVANILDTPIQQDFPDFSKLMNSWLTILRIDLPAVQTSNTKPHLINQASKHLTWNSDLFTTQIWYRNQELDLSRVPIHKIYATYKQYFGQGNETPPTLQFKVTLPIAPDNSNANQISNEGKTLLWDLKFGQKNPIFMTVEIPNPITISILSSLALLFLGLTLYTAWSKQKKL